MFDVNPSLIRFWEKKFNILKPHKNKKGNRMFTPADIENLKLIYHLVKEKGMTLAGAEKRIKENKEGLKRDMEIVDRLLAIKSILTEVREELKAGSDEIVLADEASETVKEAGTVIGAGAGTVFPEPEEEKHGTAPQTTEAISDDEEEIEKAIELELDRLGEASPWDDEDTYGADEGDFFNDIPEDGTPQDCGVETLFGNEDEPEITAQSIETVITESVEAILGTESPEPEYIAELSVELTEDAETAAEVMETLAEMDGKDKEQPKRPEIYEQTLF